MPTFHDHFSSGAAAYARYRPSYPSRLYQFLAGLAPTRELAWDCGTGSGQAAVGLAAHFTRVIATDPSREQLAAAAVHGRVEYHCAPAEASGLEPGSADLIAAAQAAHWFDIDRFYVEVMRVAKPGAAIALWCYSLASLGTDFDPTLRHFATGVLGRSWPPERSYVDRHYRTLPFPFEELPAPAFRVDADWTFGDVMGYIGTWSALRKYREENVDDPLDWLERELRRFWGDPYQRRTVSWPIHMRVGVVGDRW